MNVVTLKQIHEIRPTKNLRDIRQHCTYCRY